MSNKYEYYFNYYGKLFDQIKQQKKCFKLDDTYFTINNVEIQNGGCGCCGAKYSGYYVTGLAFTDNQRPDEYEAYVSFYYLGCHKFKDNEGELDDDCSDVEFRSSLVKDPNMMFFHFIPKVCVLVDIPKELMLAD